MGSVPERVPVSTYITPETLAQAKLVAVRTDRTLYQVLADALIAEIEIHITPAERIVAREQAALRMKREGKSNVVDKAADVRTTKRKGNSAKRT